MKIFKRGFWSSKKSFSKKLKKILDKQQNV